MADKKIIAVVGATGAQGSGLVRAILADKSGPFRPRALTRTPGPKRQKPSPTPVPRWWLRMWTTLRA